jgi:hypothetical protein
MQNVKQEGYRFSTISRAFFDLKIQSTQCWIDVLKKKEMIKERPKNNKSIEEVYQRKKPSISNDGVTLTPLGFGI